MAINPVVMGRFREILAWYGAKDEWTQGKLAEAVGVSQGTISKWMLGGLRPPGDQALLELFCKVLRVTEQEREEFIEDALLANTPAWIAERYVEMKKQLAKKPEGPSSSS